MVISGGKKIQNQSSVKYSSNDLCVTVVTVVYNGGKVIEKTINSVLSQTYQNIEYIVVDGFSIDETVSILKRYDKKIDYWISEKDEGIYDAMNKGIGFATGKWVIFMNAGDIFYCDNVIEKVFANPVEEFGVIAGGVHYEFGLKFGKIKNAIINVSQTNIEFPHHQSSFFRIDLLKKYLYDSSYKIRAELDLYLRLYISGNKWMIVDDVISSVDTTGISSRLSWMHFYEEALVGNKCVKYYFFKLAFFYLINVIPRYIARKMMPKKIEAWIRSKI